MKTHQSSMPQRLNEKIISRYRQNYKISLDYPLTIELVQSHWDLERHLRDVLLTSTSENRWETAERAYQDLYTLLNWHNDAVFGKVQESYTKWVRTIGLPPKRIYEVGSGRGALLREFVTHGHQCRGTEITRERGQKYLADESTISWGNTDGVHLDHFEAPESFDVVISNQVIEHLHPDDLPEHFRSARRLLADRGMYLFSTPHYLTGPHDLGLVFELERAEGMHLKEYSWRELRALAKAEGFPTVYAATTSSIAHRLRAFVPEAMGLRILGTTYLMAMIILESALGFIPVRKLQQAIARTLKRTKIFSDNIFLVCHTD